MQAHLDGAGSGADELGDLAVAQPLEAGQQQHLAIGRRQALQLALDAGRPLAVELSPLRRAGSEKLGHLAAGHAALPGEVRPGGVARDPQQPGHEGCARAVGASMSQDAHEGLLHQVLGGRGAAHQAAQEAEQAPRVALEERCQPRQVAAPHGAHQLLVGDLVVHTR